MFGESYSLSDYIAAAFEYTHRPGIRETIRWPELVSEAEEKIKSLQALLKTEQPPKELVQATQSVLAQLIEYLARHPEELYQIRPRQFEELIAEILAAYGWEVQLTPPTKDGGYDIFAISKDIAGVSTSWIVECKKYAPDRKVGVEIARSLYGVKTDLRVANAMLATTSDFTKGVKEFKASRYDFELKDYQAVLDWINEYRPNPTGKIYVKDHRLIVGR